MNCQNCGGQIPEGTAFCPTCGAQVQQAPTQPVQPQGGQQYNGQQVPGGTDTNTEKVIAIVSYLGIIGLIIYLAKAAKTPFGQFHAKQGANICIIQLIASVAIGVIRGVISYVGIPFIGTLLGLVNTAIWIISLVGLIWAAQGKMEKLPVIDKIEILK
jgi:uncharacterized membrane protein